MGWSFGVCIGVALSFTGRGGSRRCRSRKIEKYKLYMLSIGTFHLVPAKWSSGMIVASGSRLDTAGILDCDRPRVQIPVWPELFAFLFVLGFLPLAEWLSVDEAIV